MAKWFVSNKKADFNQIAADFKIDPVIARVIRNRDIISKEEIDKFLNGTLDDLHSPFLLKDMEKAVSILIEKMDKNAKIRIIGDYDIDGVCAAFILYNGLSFLNATVDVAIPHRMKDGYGLNENLIQEAYEAGIDTIVTCDNGIAAMKEIQQAKELGMTVIVTDHHEVPYEDKQEGRIYLLPKADAIIDPKQEECKYPFHGICGGVVAYKVIEAIYQEYQKVGLSEEDRENRTQKLKELLEFAAFATVGDVMSLIDENRIIVKFGLRYMKDTKNLGLKALIEVNDLEEKEISPFHIGFVLGPCLNATGRLDSAKRAFQLLSATTRKEAIELATDLKELNESRKEMTVKGVEEAISQIENSKLKDDKVLIIYLPDCHESLAGIIAGRIREKYGKPAFVLTKAEDGLKGSGRSIEQFHMYEEMNKEKELFTKFGGHKLAAGLSMKEEKLNDFRVLMNQNCNLTEDDFIEKITIDVPMPVSYIRKDLIRQLSLLEPFGMGNPKPVFAQKEVTIVNYSIIGKNKNVIKGIVSDQFGERIAFIYFGEINKFMNRMDEHKSNVSILFYPSLNEFRGSSSIQIIIQDIQ